MPPRREAVRIAIAGASSLTGKDLREWIDSSGFPAGEVRLLDEELVSGTLTEAIGEPAVIETITEDSFENVRFALFTGSREFSVRHEGKARSAGATVIDLSGGLVTTPGARIWMPALDSILTAPPPISGAAQHSTDENPKLLSLFVAPSAPANVAAALSAAFAPLGLSRLILTFHQPVSERGREGIEEFEGQMIKLLSLQPISQSVFDAQVGFNMLASFGPASADKISDARAAIVAETKAYLAGRTPLPAIELVQAPVFYSHTFSGYAEFARTVSTEEMIVRMQSAGLKVTESDEAPPNNVSVTGEAHPVLGRPERDPDMENAVWIWGAADNLRIPVANALAIAEKLLAS